MVVLCPVHRFNVYILLRHVFWNVHPCKFSWSKFTCVNWSCSSILPKRISRQSRTWDQLLDWCVLFGILRIELIPEGERPLRWDTWFFPWGGQILGEATVGFSQKTCSSKGRFGVAISWRSQRSYTLEETNISPKNAILKMIFLFPRWDMLIPWRVVSL